MLQDLSDNESVDLILTSEARFGLDYMEELKLQCDTIVLMQLYIDLSRAVKDLRRCL